MVRLTDRPDMNLDVYRVRKTTIQQQQQLTHDSAAPPTAILRPWFQTAELREAGRGGEARVNIVTRTGPEFMNSTENETFPAHK